METSTRIIDYHLKERIERQNSKITVLGRSLQENGLKTLPTYLHSNKIGKPEGFGLKCGNKKGRAISDPAFRRHPLNP
jgi:hypothetical protein